MRSSLDEMVPEPLHFTVLRYSPPSRGRGWIFLLVITGDDLPVRIVIRPDWADGLAANEREYLSELMEDWLGTSSDSADLLMEQLRELSVGSMQTVEAGSTTTHEEIETLIQRVHSGQFWF